MKNTRVRCPYKKLNAPPGRSGAGKTNAGFLILDNLKKHNKPFLVFDWKRNYRDLLSNSEFKDVEVYTIGRNITPFTFNPLIPPQGTNAKTWLRALSSLCFGDMDTLLNTDNNKSIDHILDKNVILELDALTQSDKTFFVQACLLYIHHKRLVEETREDFKHAIIIEEAHHVLSDERRSLVGGQSVMEIIFREIREFGESLILLDQHPSKISLSALGNTYCTICMNLKHKTDINAMSQCMLMDKDRDILGSLDVGHAVVKLQGRTVRPFEITLPLFAVDKGKITDEFIKEHMKNTIPEIIEEDFRLNWQNVNESQIKKPDNEIAFLKNVVDYPNIGIAERYRQLGISVRQGQKLKGELLKKGLVEESRQTTQTGRLIIICITEKGQQLL